MAQQATPAVDMVIDEWAGDIDPQERDVLADEMAYQYYSGVREQLGSSLDASTAEQINKLARIPPEEKEAIYQRSNRVMRRIVRPLGYKLLQLQGLDPSTASPEAARAALDAPLTPEQQEEVSRKLGELYEAVYAPEVKAAVEELGLQDSNPDQVWQEFEQEVKQRRQPSKAQQRSSASVALPSALAGAVVALVVSRLFGWLKRRRQGASAGSSRQLTEDEYYGEEGLASDSLQDDASAYAE